MGIRDTSAGHPTHHWRARWPRPDGTTAALVAGAGVAVLIGSAPLPAAWQRAWASHAYPAVQARLTPLAAALPVPALDVLIVLVGMAGLWLGIRLVGRRAGARQWLLRVVVMVAFGWLTFQLLWGWHYQTPTLDTRFAVTRAALDGRVREVTTHGVSRLNALHADVHGRAWPGPTDRPDDLVSAMRDVLRDLHVPGQPVLPLPRYTLVDLYFRWAGIDGLTNPFGLEVVLNSRLLDVERPAVLAHEWAHVAGFADESDASFVGWMAGVRAGGQQEYAAWLGVLPHLAGALSPDDRTSVLGGLAAGPMADLRAIAVRAAERWPAIQDVAWRVYDRFLKANRVTEGVARYDAVTLLLLTAADERTGRLRQSVPAP